MKQAHRTPTVGDEIEVTGHTVEEARRHGVVVEVLGDDPHPHFRVRWDDGHETVLFPGSDVTVRTVTRAHPDATAK